MIEKVKKVSNPLTIVAIFAALAEVSGTGALVAVGDASRQIVVWFVVLFPVLLLVLFFVTLNFNPRVLYSPSDYKNESYFFDLIKSTQVATADLAVLETSIDKSRTEISGLVTKIKVENQTDKDAILEKIDQSFRAVAGSVSTQRAKLESTFEEYRGFDPRRMPNNINCPECGKIKGLGLTECGDYQCGCGHGITFGDPWWELRPHNKANTADAKKARG